MYQSKCRNCGEPDFFTVRPPDRVKCTSCGNTYRTSDAVESSSPPEQPRPATTSPAEPETQVFPLLSNRFSIRLSFLCGVALVAVVIGWWAGVPIQDEHFHLALLWLLWGTVFFMAPLIGKWNQAFHDYGVRTASSNVERRMLQEGHDNNSEDAGTSALIVMLFLGGVLVWMTFFAK